MMRTWFSIENKATDATIHIYDEIGGFGITSSVFVAALAQVKASRIALRINSPGGNVFDGVTIYNALVRHPAQVTTHIDGIAASIASVIALAGDEVRIADNAFFVIHNPFAVVAGTAEDMRKAADTLDQVSEDTLIAAYMKKADVTREQLRAWMDEEKWFSAQEALEAGFVDVVDNGKEMKNLVGFSMSNFKRIPQEIAARINAPAASGTESKPGVSGVLPVVKLIRHRTSGATK